MTQDVAVNLMLEKEIIPNPLIPVEACPYIAKALERMWQVGFEASTISRTHELPEGVCKLAIKWIYFSQKRSIFCR